MIQSEWTHPASPDPSSAFDVMVALTRSSLRWVLHTWMSGTNLLQTPRAWFWGTRKFAISAVLIGGRMSRIAGNVLVFGPLLLRGIELRSIRQSSWDGYSVCSGLFWDERWWSVGIVVVMKCVLICILQSFCGRWVFVCLCVFLFVFFCVPQLSLWGSPLLGEIFAYVTVF